MLKIFTIPVPNDGLEEEALNAFLRSHRILSVEKEREIRK
jgi:hypothetical protein